MFNQTTKNPTNPTKTTENPVAASAAKTVAQGKETVQVIRDSLVKTFDETIGMAKHEADDLTRLGRQALTMASKEVAKRPLTYTIAAAITGALVGLGLRSKNRTTNNKA